MESDMTREAAADTEGASAATSLLQRFIEENADLLVRTLEMFARRAGFADSHTPIELLNQVCVEALENAERFDCTRQPRAWLLGIAANLIQRRKAESTRQKRREISVSDLVGDSNATTDEDVFDRLVRAAVNQGAPELEADQEVDRLLAPLSTDDRQVVKLAVLEEMDSVQVACTLGISPGAARVRLYRALRRLRKALNEQETRGI
jgi:RNA polymerase sigma-70 factor (ECF subfamily)